MWLNVFPPAVTVMMDQGISLHPGPGEPTVIHGQVRLKFLDALVRARTRLQRGVTQTFAVFSVVFLLLWISAFLYGSLYYSYMPNVAFSTTVHYYHRYACKLTCTSKTNITYSAVSLSAGQTVSHLHRSCALIHWPMCLWQGTGSMYVCNVCGSCSVYTSMQLINDLSSKWVFRCWHSGKPIRSLCCWKCQILLPIRHWGCSWSRQRSTPRMEARFSPQLSLYVRWISAILLWYAKLKCCCFVLVLWHHCRVLLRQVKCCQPPALVL